MLRLIRCAALGLVVFALVGCEKGGGDTAKTDEAKASKASGKRAKGKKDRGAAKAMLGEELWEAKRARARLKGSRLTIKASRTDVNGKDVKRQEVHLAVKDFKGPGTYECDPMGSRFIGVGMSAEQMDQAGKDDKSAQEAVGAALSGSKFMMLAGAEVVITAVSDTEISGTFSWSPPEGSKQPAIRDGSFRAIVR